MQRRRLRQFEDVEENGRRQQEGEGGNDRWTNILDGTSMR
jgi:hypothetical protein